MKVLDLGQKYLPDMVKHTEDIQADLLQNNGTPISRLRMVMILNYLVENFRPENHLKPERVN